MLEKKKETHEISDLTIITNETEYLTTRDSPELDRCENEAPALLERRGNVVDTDADVSGRRLSPQGRILGPIEGEPADPTPTKCQRIAADLRLLADWVEAQPDVPFTYHLNPDHEHQILCPLSSDKTRMREQLRAIGPFDKVISDTFFEAHVKLGHFTLEFYTELTNVCIKKVVGAKEVPAEIIPSKYVPEKVIEAHTEEVVEWVCGSLLAPGEGEDEPSEG
jgi:hypothetical protein